MFERLKGVFAREQNSDVETESTTVPLAAAMLLLEVAWADHELEDRELEQVKVALESMYEIDQDQGSEIVDRARADHEKSTGVFPFTRLLNERLDRSERKALLVHLWRVANFEGDQEHYEEHVIRKITDLLYLNHSDFIAAKREVQSNN
ncbi:MAG: TerB family tellurite resistance protein [Pseudomonadota bacterium]|nr:TerB family tellurite resistance protein [Pseudomonadota bacterium]MEC9285142.1 TerB family tellurite resistance protein [Pseudomonadota bacterium]|tara:strand:- start:153 stop:599 length:447 start_codon:yes stop_codon:yes gene_type:complete